jgi:hypothetical protein
MKRGKNSDCDFGRGGILASYVVPNAQRQSCHSMPIMASGRKKVSRENRGKIGEIQY